MHVTGSYAATSRLAHLGGLMAFTAAFAGLYVLCASIALGFNIMQALMIDLAVFAGGLTLWFAPRAGKVIVRWRRVAAHQQAGRALTLAGKTSFAVVPQPAHYGATAKARPLSQPGLVPFGLVFPAG